MQISKSISYSDLVTSERFVLASGPGGQNVNKVATAVELRLNVDDSTALDERTRSRLKKIAGKKLTSGGEILIVSKRFRSQGRNRQDARERLVKLIQTAMESTRPRKKTKKPKGADRRRLDNKKKRGDKKKLRSRPPID